MLQCTRFTNKQQSLSLPEIIPEMTECKSLHLVRTSLVKVAKLQCKTAGHGPSLSILVGGGGGNHSYFWSKTVFFSPNNFHDVDDRALVLSDGQSK